MFDAIIPIAPGTAALKKSLVGDVFRKNSFSESMILSFKTIELTP